MSHDSTTPSGLPTSGPNRRQFARALAGSAVGVFAAPAILRGRNLSERLKIAVVGVGGRGGSNLHDVAGEDIVALCDVAEAAPAGAASAPPRPRRYRDFRRLYDNAGDFDAVVVSTTEHTHAFAT